MATIVNVSGSGDVNYCYAKINGTNYIGEVSNITLKSNTIVFEVFGAGGNPGTVTIDGDTVLTYELGNATYSWAVPSNVTEINIVLTDKNFYTTVTVTTKKAADPHSTTIGGTAREIESGTILIGGVLREIESGLVLVNGVAREIAFGSAKAKVSQLSVGDIVLAPVSGVQKEFIVVHQGNPNSDMYDDSCNGTWLLMKDIYENRQFHSDNRNRYQNSTIHTYLNNSFLNLFDSAVKELIKTVKIPYRASYNGAWNTGANGLSTSVFLLSSYEVGSNGSGVNVDGAKLDYFEQATTTSAKRVAYYNGVASDWWTRSLYSSGNTTTWYVDTDGWPFRDVCENKHGIRPAFILDPETQYDPNTMEILY